MIRTRHLLLVGVAAVLLSACNVTARTDKAKVKVPGVEVEVGDDGHHDRDHDYDHDHDKDEGGFCPPGQHKKGRC